MKTYPPATTVLDAGRVAFITSPNRWHTAMPVAASLTCSRMWFCGPWSMEFSSPRWFSSSPSCSTGVGGNAPLDWPKKSGSGRPLNRPLFMSPCRLRTSLGESHSSRQRSSPRSSVQNRTAELHACMYATRPSTSGSQVESGTSGAQRAISVLPVAASSTSPLLRITSCCLGPSPKSITANRPL